MPLTISADSTMTGPDGVMHGQCLSLSDPNSAVGNNSPCVSVTVCPPGATTINTGPPSPSASPGYCQTISGLLLDTGSVGLRVFRSVLNPRLLNQLTQPSVGGQGVAECVTYGDGSADWGPVANATVFLAQEPGVNAPIQIIDPNYGTNNSATSSGPQICLSYDAQTAGSPYLDQSPVNIPAAGATAAVQGLGYNGILGVGLSTVDSGAYYRCTPSPTLSPSPFLASGCDSTGIVPDQSQELHNPVSLLPQDYNGEVIVLPSVGASGDISAFGYLVLGIGTQPNNTPLSSVTPFFANPSTLEVNAILNSASNGAFIDSGTTYYQIPTGSSTTGVLEDCITYYPALSGFLCPKNNSITPVSLAFPFFGNTTLGVNQIAVSIGNPGILISTTSKVLSDVANSSGLQGFPGNTVGLGLPFYLGRTIYHGISGLYSPSFGNGPYWAF